MLGQKLVGLFLIMAVIVVITGFLGIFSLNRVGRTIEKFIMTGATQSNQVVLMKTALQESRLHLLEAATTDKAADFETIKADYQLKRDRFNSYMEIILKGNAKLGLPAAPKGSPLEERAIVVATKFAEFGQTADKLLSRKEREISSGRGAGAAASDTLAVSRSELPERTDQVTTAVDELLVTVNGMMQQANNTAAAIKDKAQLTLIAVITAAILAAIYFGILVSNSIVSRVKKMADASNRLADGDLSVVVDPAGHDEIATLGMAMNKMAANLKELIKKTQTRNIELEEWQRDELWSKSGLNELNNILREDQKTAELAEKALSYIIGYLGAGVGVIYLYDEKDETLETISTYAIANAGRLRQRLHLGEGLAGQTALERKTIHIDSVPHDYLPITSSLGEADPVEIIVLPIMHNNKLAGVLELGSFKAFDSKNISFLQQAAAGIAIAIQANRSRQLVNELLEQTQSQAEELRVQQEELQQTNEELAERARMLAKQG